MTEKEKFEQKMDFIRKNYGLNTFDEVMAEMDREGPINIGIFVSGGQADAEGLRKAN